jgi:hypothetical protein
MITDEFETFQKRKKPSELDLLFSNKKNILEDVATSFIKQNYRCPDGTVEEGSFKKDLLNDVSDFIKQNYKCRREDSPDGSNKCSIVNPAYSGKSNPIREAFLARKSSNKTNVLVKKVNKVSKVQEFKPTNSTTLEQPTIVSDVNSKTNFNPNELPWKEAKPFYEDYVKSLPFQEKSVPLGKMKVYNINKLQIQVQKGVNNAELGRMLYHASRLPSNLISNKPNIVILNHSSEVGKNLSEKYSRKFQASGTTSGKDITIYNAQSNDTITHEIAHTLDGPNNDISNSVEYLDAVNKDNNGFTSQYAKDSYKVYNGSSKIYCEDFAVGVASFLGNKELFEKSFPNRAKLYRKILGV